MKHRLLLALILAAGAGAYLPTIDHAFQYDDERKIVNNPNLRDPLNFFRAFKMKGYQEETTRLIPNLTFALNYLLFGIRPWGYNATNLLIHLLNVWLVARLGRAVLRRLGRKDSFLPLLGAAIFALHPLNTEAVNYCNARPNMIATTFYLLALLALLRALDSSLGLSSDRSLVRRWFVSSVFLLLVLMSKELALSIFLLIPFLFRWLGGGKGERYGKLFPWMWGLIPGGVVIGTALGAVTGAMAGLEYVLEQGTRLTGNTPLFMILTILGQSGIMMAYFGQALLPLPRFLNVDHGTPHLYERLFPRNNAPAEPLGSAVAVPALCLLALLAMFFAAILWRRRSRFATFFLLWPMFAHAPTSLLPRGEAMVEYRTYLPMVGVCFLLAWGVEKGVLLLSSARARIPAVLLLLGAFALGTAVRNRAWRTPLTLWTDSLEKAPGNFRVVNNVGTYLERQNRFDEAMKFHLEALRIEPNHPEVQYNVGVMLSRQGRTAEAAARFAEATRINPGYAEAHYALGITLEKQGKPEEAMARYAEAARIRPQFAEAHYNLGTLLAQRDRIEEAVEHFSAAVRARPDYAKAHYNLGFLLAGLGRRSEAAAHFSEALRLKPDYEDARRALDLIK